MTTSLQNELIVVSGASTGMGAATARALAEQSYHVLAGVRRPRDADAIRAANIEPVILDITIPEAGRIFDEQRIGERTPNAPVLITSGINDDTIPYGQARQLATDWCGQGASVEFRSNPLPPILQGAVLPNHFGPQLIDGYGGGAAQFLMDRFADVPLAACTFD